jgi:lipopolysaccharide/colanic/teichoic acid biosynthesis glycosyltransferase
VTTCIGPDERRPVRLLQRGIALVVLIAVSPVLLFVVLWIIAVSGLPALYVTPRVGFRGAPFSMLKVRTLRRKEQGEPWALTVASNDPRLVRGGRTIRLHKLDELPQLWNIVRGEMAFVGPRPEMQEYIQSYTPSDWKTLQIPPGLTDLASLRYFDLPAELGADPRGVDESYRRDVHAERMRLRREYVATRSFRGDTRILGATVLKALSPRLVRGGPAGSGGS